MSDPVFERYKLALKEGHVAVLRGKLEDALRFYQEAARLADSRPLPHSSMGGVLLRLGRVNEAIAAYEQALRRAPRDEAAMSGRSEALQAAGRRDEAAAILDDLAELQATAGRRPESLATRDLARSIRNAVAAEAATLAAVAAAAEKEAAAKRAADEEAAADRAERAEEEAAGRAAAQEGAPEPEPMVEPAPEPEPEPEPEPAAPPPAPGATLLLEAEVALQAGDTPSAAERYVQAAEAFAREGASDAAIDACHQALGLVPGSPETHLVLAQVYFGRGWRDRAAEKLVLLDRLLELEAAPEVRVRMIELIRREAADDERLAPVLTRAAPARTAGDERPSAEDPALPEPERR